MIFQTIAISILVTLNFMTPITKEVMVDINEVEGIPKGATIDNLVTEYIPFESKEEYSNFSGNLVSFQQMNNNIEAQNWYGSHHNSRGVLTENMPEKDIEKEMAGDMTMTLRAGTAGAGGAGGVTRGNGGTFTIGVASLDDYKDNFKIKQYWKYEKVVGYKWK